MFDITLAIKANLNYDKGMPNSTPKKATQGSRTLPQIYRRFGEVDMAGTSPLYEHLAIALSGSNDALNAIEALPARKRRPALVLAALHQLALIGRAPALADAYTNLDTGASTRAAIAALTSLQDELSSVLQGHQINAVEATRCAVLYPAVTEVARRVDAQAISLINVGSSISLNHITDRVHITYNDGTSLGDPTSPVHLTCSVVNRSVPARIMPSVRSRSCVDPKPVDLTDQNEVSWLRACIAPDQALADKTLSSQINLMENNPPKLFPGDILEQLPKALSDAPKDALPVVVTTWTLSQLSLEHRLRFLHCLDAGATDRPIAWVSLEGVGTAPAIPTFGDRRASGHSIVGIAIFDHTSLMVEAIGRCWSKGRVMSWLSHTVSGSSFEFPTAR